SGGQIASEQTSGGHVSSGHAPGGHSGGQSTDTGSVQSGAPIPGNTYVTDSGSTLGRDAHVSYGGQPSSASSDPRSAVSSNAQVSSGGYITDAASTLNQQVAPATAGHATGGQSGQHDPGVPRTEYSDLGQTGYQYGATAQAGASHQSNAGDPFVSQQGQG